MATLQQIDQTTPYPDGSFGDDAFDAFRKTNENMLALQKAADLTDISLIGNQSIYWDGTKFVAYSVSPAARAVLAATDNAAMRTAMGAVGNVGNENIFGVKTFTENNAIRSRAAGAGVWLESTAAGTTTGFMLNASGDNLTLNLRELNFGAQRSSVFQARLTDFRIGLPLIPFSANTMTIGTAAFSFSNVFTNELTVNGSAAQKAASLASIGGASATALAAEATARADADTALGLRFRGKNRIINGDFRIWQRGSSFTTTGYCADRWVLNVAGILAPSVVPSAVTPGSPTFLYSKSSLYATSNGNNNASGHFFALEQRIEDVYMFAGQTCTMSLVLFNEGAAGRKISIETIQRFGDSGSATIAGIAPQVFTLAAGYNRIIYTVNVPSISGKTVGANSSLCFYIWLSAGTDFNARSGSLGPQTVSLKIGEVQVEHGAVATTFEYRNDAEEILLCQRYYEKSYNVDVNPGTPNGLGRVNTFYDRSTSGASTSDIRFRVTKRAVPALTVYSDSTGIVNQTSGNNGTAGTVANLVNVGTSGAQMNYTPGGGASWGASFHFTADAEL